MHSNVLYRCDNETTFAGLRSCICLACGPSSVNSPHQCSSMVCNSFIWKTIAVGQVDFTFQSKCFKSNVKNVKDTVLQPNCDLFDKEMYMRRTQCRDFNKVKFPIWQERLLLLSGLLSCPRSACSGAVRSLLWIQLKSSAAYLLLVICSGQPIFTCIIISRYTDLYEDHCYYTISNIDARIAQLILIVFSAVYLERIPYTAHTNSR